MARSSVHRLRHDHDPADPGRHHGGTDRSPRAHGRIRHPAQPGQPGGKAIGTEATRLTLDYAFHITNLRCVYLSMPSPNTAAIGAHEKAGFRMIGERRQSGYWLGQSADETLVDTTPADFPGPSVVRYIVDPNRQV